MKNQGDARSARPATTPPGEAAAPVARLARAALERGLYLMTHWNVVMVVPPLTITREEAEEGVAILDDVPRDRRRVRGLDHYLGVEERGDRRAGLLDASHIRVCPPAP